MKTNKDRIQLNSSQFGTGSIQIYIFAADKPNKILVMSEAKEFLSFQAVSEFTEQLYLKKYLLENFLNNDLGRDKAQKIKKKELQEYLVIRYVVLGSYSDDVYESAKAKNRNDLKIRIDEYSKYFSGISRYNIGILLYSNQDDKDPLVKRAVLERWQ